MAKNEHKIKQLETLQAIREYISRQRSLPSTADLKKSLGMTREATQSRLKTLEKHGHIASVGKPPRYVLIPQREKYQESNMPQNRKRPVACWPDMVQEFGPNDLYKQFQEHIDSVLVPDVHLENIEVIVNTFSREGIGGDVSMLFPFNARKFSANDEKELLSACSLWSVNELNLIRELLFGNKSVIVYSDEPGRGKSTIIRVLFEHNIKETSLTRGFIPCIIDSKRTTSLYYAYDLNQFVKYISRVIEPVLYNAVIAEDPQLEAFSDFVSSQPSVKISPYNPTTTLKSLAEIQALIAKVWKHDDLRPSILFAKFLNSFGNGLSRVILIFDNLDQLSVLVQLLAIRFVSTLAAETRSRAILVMRNVTHRVQKQLAFLPLRDYSFSDRANTFAVVKNKPALLGGIIEKRLARLAQPIDESVVVSTPSASLIVTTRLIWSTIKETLSRKSILSFLESFTGRDIQLTMLLLAEYFSSAFLDQAGMAAQLAKADLDLEVEHKRVFNVDEVLRTIILRNKSAYVSSDSDRLIVNLYRTNNSSTDFGSILRYYVLRYVHSKDHPVVKKEASNSLMKFGLDNSEIEDSIDRLIHASLFIHFPSFNSDMTWFDRNTIPDDSYIEITPRGTFYLNTVSHKLEYFQHMVDDTFLDTDLLIKYKRNAWSHYRFRIYNALLLIRQVLRDDIRLRNSLIKRSAILYDEFCIFAGEDLFAGRLMSDLQRSGIERHLGSEFGRHQKVHVLKRLADILSREIKRESNQFKALHLSVRFLERQRPARTS